MDGIRSYYRGRRVLVTGGLGFIGSNLARRLWELGADVVVVDSLQPNTGANRANPRGLEGRICIRVVDLTSPSEIADLLPGCSVVFNLAGRGSHLDSMTDPLCDLTANVHAQIVLLEACRRYASEARIVFASTRQVYGRPSSCPVAESHPLRPVDANGINKMAAEAYHLLYRQVYGLQTVCLRLTNVFGPRMRIKDARQTFLGLWLRRVLEGSDFEVWGGQQKRDLLYVEDAVDAFLAAAVLSTITDSVFNVGGTPAVTLTNLAELLVEAAGRGRFEIRSFPPERLSIDIGDYYTNDQLFRGLTDWAPKVSVREGLARTIAYYQGCLRDYV
jgi:UDP-glucose 4-epimerase